MKQTLVTGGAGFIGSHVVRALLDQGHAVRVLHLPDEDLRNLAGLDVDCIAGDITDFACVQGCVADCDWVFHLAALYALWVPSPTRMREVNIQGTHHVLRACLEADVSRVVYTSSIAVFGGQGPGQDATEQSNFALASTGDLYSQTKFESHAVALHYAREGLNVVIVAPCAPIGPGDIGPTPTGKILLSAATWPLPFVIDMQSNFADVRDMAQGHVLAALHGKAGQSYLLGSGNHSAQDLARITLEELGVQRPIVQVPLFLAATAARVAQRHAQWRQRPPLVTPAVIAIARLGLRASCTKAVQELGMPQRPIRESIHDALVWWARHDYLPRRRAQRLRGR